MGSDLSVKQPTVLSVFTGAGGMDEGFRAAGFKVIGAIEKEDWATATLRLNHPDMRVMGPPEHSGDVTEISDSNVLDFLGVEEGEIDLIVGGPPCQPFSQAASQRFWRQDPRYKRRGFEDDVKGNLLFDFIRLVTDLKPKVFLIENVPGLMSIDGGEQLALALKLLAEQGYNHTVPEVLNAVDYGVPQFRTRLIIWGSKKLADPTLPAKTHGEASSLFSTVAPYSTVAQALARMPRDLPNHVTRDHTPECVKRYQTLQFGEREQLGRVDRLDPCRPSKTVIAGGMKGGGRSHLHPFIARTLSVRECARLQTFSDDYVFDGSIARQFTQVGNAVPPLLAEHLARHIMLLEFGKQVSGPFKHEAFLKRSLSPGELSLQMLEDALEEKPEWVYNDHGVSRREGVTRVRRQGVILEGQALSLTPSVVK